MRLGGRYDSPRIPPTSGVFRASGVAGGLRTGAPTGSIRATVYP